MKVEFVDHRALCLKNIEVGDLAVTVEGEIRVFTRISLAGYSQFEIGKVIKQKPPTEGFDKTPPLTLIIELTDLKNQHLDYLQNENLLVRKLETGEFIKLLK